MARKKVCRYLLVGLLILGVLGIGYYIFWNKQETKLPEGTLVEINNDISREEDVIC